MEEPINLGSIQLCNSISIKTLRIGIRVGKSMAIQFCTGMELTVTHARRRLRHFRTILIAAGPHGPSKQ